MGIRYFDAHCHIQFPPYDEDRNDLLTAMEVEGIGGLVVGVDERSSEGALELVRPRATLWATAGLHPNSAGEFSGIEPYRQLAKDPRVVAIGECGLDYYRPDDPEAAQVTQREVFEAHVALAAELGKPLMIHARPRKGTADAYHDLIDILRSAKQEHGDALRGNVHFFVGGVDEARSLIDLDFTVSFTAVLTFARDYDEVVRFVPLTHIITETDSPYVAPAPNRGKRNDPRSVKSVVSALAGIRGEDEEIVRVHIIQNAQKLFTLPSGLF